VSELHYLGMLKLFHFISSNSNFSTNCPVHQWLYDSVFVLLMTHCLTGRVPLNDQRLCMQMCCCHVIKLVDVSFESHYLQKITKTNVRDS